MNDKYIMTPELFEQLTYVYGFEKMNGKNYMEHITITRPDIPDDVQKQILTCSDPEKALEILSDNNIPYTHEYIDDNYVQKY